MMETIIDNSGRTITLRQVGILEQLRLFKALGPTLSANDAYMNIALIAAAVSQIDDLPIPFPATEASVEGIISRLGDVGVRAVDQALPAPTQAEILADAGN